MAQATSGRLSAGEENEIKEHKANIIGMNRVKGEPGRRTKGNERKPPN